MKPRPEPPRESDAAAIPDRVLERIAAPMTVMHANIQLLQRRVRRGNAPDPDALLRALAKMEQASRTIIAQLREAEHRDPPKAEEHGKMTETRGHAMHDEGA